MVWHRKDDMSLSKPVMTRFGDINMQLYGETSQLNYVACLLVEMYQIDIPAKCIEARMLFW